MLFRSNLKNNAVSDHDLLYAESNGYFDKTQTEAVQLEFYHQLSKLILNVKVEKENEAGSNEVSDAIGWTGSIYRSSTADFNLEDRSYSNLANSSAFDLNPASSSAQTLIIPGKEGKVSIQYDGKDYEWNTENIDFKKGFQYTYTITLEPAAVVEPDEPDVEVKLESSIHGWDKESGEVSLDEITDDGGDEGEELPGNPEDRKRVG